MSRSYVGTITGRGQLWQVQLGEDAPVHLRTLFVTTPGFFRCYWAEGQGRIHSHSELWLVDDH